MSELIVDIQGDSEFNFNSGNVDNVYVRKCIIVEGTVGPILHDLSLGSQDLTTFTEHIRVNPRAFMSIALVDGLTKGTQLFLDECSSDATEEDAAARIPDDRLRLEFLRTLLRSIESNVGVCARCRPFPKTAHKAALAAMITTLGAKLAESEVEE
jgi:hypothetical protein